MLICEFPVNCIFVTFHLTLTVQNLWLPDVEILDLKAFETHSVLSKLEGWEDFLKTQNMKMLHVHRSKILSTCQNFANHVFKKVFQSHFLQESGLTQIWRSCMRLPQGKNLFGNISSCIVHSVMSQYCNIACLAISILQYGLFGNITM